MNDHSNSLPPAGDDALQARIVAWVLGEASPFEAAELEKLCAENPRLRDFERRTRDLHELLMDDAKPGMHARWQLPPDKRGKITDLLGSGLTVLHPAYSSEKVNRYFSRRILLAAAACLALSVITFPIFMSRLESKRSVGASAPEKTVDFMPSHGGGGSGGEVGESREMKSRSTLDARRSLAKDNLSRATAEGATSQYSIPDSEPLMPDLAQNGASSGLGGRAGGGGVGNGPQEPAARPAKPAAAAAVSPEQEKLKKQLAELQDGEKDLAQNDEFSENRLGERAPARVTSAPAAPPPPAPVARPAVIADAEMALPEIAAASPAGGFGFRSAGGVGAGGGGTGGSGVKATREFTYPAEYEAPQVPNTVADNRFDTLSDAPAEARDKLQSAAKGAPSEWASKSEQPNNADFIAGADRSKVAEGRGRGEGEVARYHVEDIVTGGLRSGDGAINRNNIDAVLNNPNQPVPGAAPASATAMPAGPGAKGDTKEMAEKKSLDAAAASDESLAKIPAGAVDGNKEYFFRKTVELQAEQKGKSDVAYKDSDLAWTDADEADEGTKNRVLSTANGVADGRDIARAKEVAEATVETKKSKSDTVGLSFSDDFGVATGDAVGDKGMKQEQAAPLTGAWSSWRGMAQGGLKADLSALGTKPGAAFQDGTALQNGRQFREYLLSNPEDPRVRPEGGMPTDQDYDGTLSYNSSAHFEAASRGLLIDGALNTNGTDTALWSKSLADLQSSGQPLPEGGDRFRMNVFAGAQLNFDKAPTLSLDSLAVLDGKRGGENLYYSNYYSDPHTAYPFPEPPAQDRFAWSAAPPITGKPMSGGTTTWFETDGPADLPVIGRLFGREAQPQTAAPATPELPAQQMAQGGGGGYSSLAQKQMIRRQSVVAKSDQLLEEGVEAYAQGKYEDALGKYKEAAQVLPNAPMTESRRQVVLQHVGDASVALAEKNLEAGKKAEAGELLQQALALVPEHAEAKQLKKRIDDSLAVGDETATATEPFSTFSLHVSDASFKLAKAALDRGEQPAAESIRPEEFYNAFDYGDPGPANGEPVVCATEQCAHPAIPQRNLMRIAVRTAAAGRGSSTPLNLTLLLDSSGSMEREDRQAAMTKAVSQLAGLLKEGDTITVAGFARQPRLLADRLPGARAQELNGIIAQTPSEGGTNLEEGIKLAEELAKRQFNPAAQNRIVLFTDGAANLGDARPEALKTRVEQLRQQGIAFDAAGFGADGLNDRLLEQLTRNGNGRYYIVDRPEDAGTGFAKQLAGAFRPAAENVKVQVRFNPARVARYKLIGFEEHRLNKEDFRNDAVDAAEMAAEEAGVALYQIEPLPGGEGELGEVSVRFRDTASGQMVERTWTMPYEPQASAFDQAPPSIQLASMAAFAAEKLRKAPLSDALDFKQLGKVFPGVKAKYPDSQSVRDLGGMIEKLK